MFAPKKKSGVWMPGCGRIVGGDVVVEVLEQHQRLVHLAAANHARVLRDHGVDDVGVQRAGRLQGVAADEVVFALVVLARVADDHRVGIVQLEVGLGREQVVPERLPLRPFLLRQHAVRVHRGVVLPAVALVGAGNSGRCPSGSGRRACRRLLLLERLLADALLILEECRRVQRLVPREQEGAAVKRRSCRSSSRRSRRRRSTVRTRRCSVRS